MEMDRSLFDPRVKWNGIGGWLLVFAIVLGLNTVPLFIQAFMILSILFSAHNGLLLLTCLVDFVYLGLLLASLILLLRHRIAFRWCYAAVVALNVCLLVWILSIGSRQMNACLPLLGQVAWLAYLFCSERVRITCGLPPKRHNTQYLIEQYVQAAAAAARDAAEAQRIDALNAREDRRNASIASALRGHARRYASAPRGSARPRAFRKVRI